MNKNLFFIFSRLLSRGEGRRGSVWTRSTCSGFLTVVRNGGSSASPLEGEVEGTLNEMSEDIEIKSKLTVLYIPQNLIFVK